MNDTHRAASTAAGAPAIAIKPSPLVWLSLLAVYVVWGSTYLVIKIALEGFPPFMMGGIRFIVAGAALFAYLLLKGTPLPTARQWRNAGITGIFLLVGGNGLVCYAELTVSSGLTAVAVAGMPLFAALIAGAYGQWPNRRDRVGLAIGFLGVILLNLSGEMRASPIGALTLLAAPVAWAFGSVWSRRQDLPGPWMSAAAQMLLGGAAMIVLALGIGERVTEVPPLRPLLAIIYLTLAGSLLAFSAYIYLLHHVRPALATSYAYVNPPIALVFGMLLLGEHVALVDVVAMVVIVTGVAVILTAKR